MVHDAVAKLLALGVVCYGKCPQSPSHLQEPTALGGCPSLLQQKVGVAHSFLTESDTDCTRVPSFLYIGSGHSGSTSLASQLDMHDDLSFGDMKEHEFLQPSGEEEFATATFEDYLAEFVVPCSVNRTFDAAPGIYGGGNPEFSRYSDNMDGTWQGHALGVPYVRAVESLLGNHLQLIMMMRDPVLYLDSHFPQPNHDLRELVKQWQSPRRHTLDNSVGRAFTRACYADSLENWLKVFPKEQFLFLLSTDYFADPQGTLDGIFRFLGVAPRSYSHEELTASGRRRSTRPAWILSTWETYHQYPAHQACDEKLKNLTGISFGHYATELQDFNISSNGTASNGTTSSSTASMLAWEQ